MEITRKYPRTYHMPFSEGLTNDDRKVPEEWWSYLSGKTLVLTEKLDGENTSIFRTEFMHVHMLHQQQILGVGICGRTVDYMTKLKIS